ITATPTIDAIVKRISWFRTKRVSISHLLQVSARKLPVQPPAAGSALRTGPRRSGHLPSAAPAATTALPAAEVSPAAAAGQGYRSVTRAHRPALVAAEPPPAEA